MGQLPVGQFQGPKENVLYKPPPHHFPPNMKSCGASAVPGPEVPVTILQNMVEAAASPEEKQEAKSELLLPNEGQELEQQRSKVYVGIENEEEGGAEGAGGEEAVRSIDAGRI